MLLSFFFFTLTNFLNNFFLFTINDLFFLFNSIYNAGLFETIIDYFPFFRVLSYDFSLFYSVLSFFISLLFFWWGLYCYLTNKTDYIRSLIFLEFMLINLSLIFAILSGIFGSSLCIAIAIAILTLSAIDVAIGLGILLHIYAYRYTLDIDHVLYYRM